MTPQGNDATVNEFSRRVRSFPLTFHRLEPL